MLIGVTGGIGSGKSTIVHILSQECGAAYYDCDRRAKRMIERNSVVRRRIVALLGELAYNVQGVYQTAYVAEQVFADPDKLARLNAIVHPALRRNIIRWAKHHPLALVESAILFQSGLDGLCSAFLVVTAPDPVRVQRVIRRAADTGRTLSEEQVLQRIRAQQDELPLARHSGKPCLLIDNGGELSPTTLCEQFSTFIKSIGKPDWVA